MSMDIDNTKPGDFVEYEFLDAGYPHQVKLAQEHLSANQRYEVERIVIQGWHTDVYLIGFEEPFNSCLFSNVSDHTGFESKDK